jgi:hypothetical protein
LADDENIEFALSTIQKYFKVASSIKNNEFDYYEMFSLTYTLIESFQKNETYPKQFEILFYSNLYGFSSNDTNLGIFNEIISRINEFFKRTKL